jgi:phytanoyl-CoA hydroxylase
LAQDGRHTSFIPRGWLVEEKFKKAMGYLTSEQIEFFHQNGYLLIPNFWSSDVVESLRNEIQIIISQLNLTETRSIFTTRDNMDSMNRDRYFLESGDVIR